MGLHFERNPEHAANPRGKDECYPCHLEQIDTFVPMRHRATGHEVNADSYSALKQDIQQALREDTEGRFQRTSRVS